MLYPNPSQQWFWWCRPWHTYYQATNVPTLPSGWKHRPPKEAARTEWCHLGQDHPRGHQCECRHRVDGLSPTRRGLTWGLCSQLAKVDPDWRSPGKSLPHRSLNTRKGVAKFGRAAIGMSNEEVKDAINSSPRNRGIPFVAEAYRVSVNRNKQRQPTGTFFLTFQATALPTKIRPGFEQFDVDLYVPSPRQCFKWQKFGHHSRTCRAKEDVCPTCSSSGHSKEACPNSDTPKCLNCKGSNSASSRECPRFVVEKAALQIQAESHCSIAKAHEQAEQASTTANDSYAAAASSQLSNQSRTFPPKCCYFAAVEGLACLWDPRGYASWSFDSW